MIKKTKSGYEVKTKSGNKTLGKHKTRKEALDQLRAIEANKGKGKKGGKKYK
jgi:hypothetical protein